MNETIQDGSLVKVFLSHKHQDKDLAKKLAKSLEEHAGQLKVFLSEEDIPPGDDWRKWIRNTLKECNILIFLYTNPSEDWDWCLYETGLFTPLEESENSRVIVLHASTIDPPRPLLPYQAVKVTTPTLPITEESVPVLIEANQDLIQNFLNRFYLTEDLTGIKLNPNLTNEKLGEIAIKISELFAPLETKTDILVKRFYLEYPENIPVEEDSISAKVIVEGENRSLEVFDITTEHCKWADIVDWAEEEGSTSWIAILAQGIYRISKGKLPKTIKSTFTGAGKGRIYRPVILSVERTEKRCFRFAVGLLEEPAPGITGGPGPKGLIFKLIRMANRFRWEVIESAIAKLNVAGNENEINRNLRHLKERIEIIENEADADNFLMPDFVKDAFTDAEDKRIVDEMFSNWAAIKEKIYNAIEAEDRDLVIENMKTLSNLNDSFMKLASKRFYQLYESDED